MTNSSKDVLDVPSLTAPMQDLHNSCENLTYKWRLKQLKQLRSMVKDHWDDWAKALSEDLGKHFTEAVCSEHLMVLTEIEMAIKKLKSWMKPESVPSPGICFPAFTWLEKRPLTGPAVLIIGPFNYPVALILSPLVGALAAGNPAVVKPSELCPASGALFAKLIPQYFEKDAVACVTGGVPETTALLKQPWGKIFFTGSATVGKIVASAAAQTLTPVALELGGKCPCYVDGPTCPRDIQQVANRIIWSKLLNTGQTCAATDTLIIDEALAPKLVPALKKSLALQYGDDPKKSSLGRIISQRHAERLVAALDEVEMDTKAEVIVGGSKDCDVEDKYIAPTIVLNPGPETRLMREEIFGPILPVITVANREEAVKVMRQMEGTPLCLYVFTSSAKVFASITNQIPAGSAMRNDCLVHLCSPFIPFGGLGSSGNGSYHGKNSFDCFSHTLPIMHRPVFPGADMNMIRYHPFGEVKTFLLTKVAIMSPPIPVLHLRVVVPAALIAGIVAIVIACRPSWFGID